MCVCVGGGAGGGKAKSTYLLAVFDSNDNLKHSF